jgi:iron complex transport system substrate-binding protein
MTRIASLVPSATETLFALGLGDAVVAVTHECNHPPAARGLTQLTATVIEPGLGEREIDDAVRERVERGEALYTLDEEALAASAPDVIVTQAVCPVCAVSHEDVVAVAARLPGSPAVVSTDPSTLADVLDEVERVGEACGATAAGRGLRRELEGRIETVGEAVSGLPRPRVAVLEWLDPVYAAGHWVPEMVAAAGAVDVLAKPGESSRVVTWEEVVKAAPEVVVVAPCGFDAASALEAARNHERELQALGAPTVAVDAAASFSRPGPRLVDGIETLAAILHPGAGVAATLEWATMQLNVPQ